LPEESTARRIAIGVRFIDCSTAREVTFSHHCGGQETRSSRWVPRPLQDGQVIAFVFCALMRLMEIMRRVFHTALLIPFDQRPYSRLHAADRVPCAACNQNRIFRNHDSRCQVFRAVTPATDQGAGSFVPDATGKCRFSNLVTDCLHNYGTLIMAYLPNVGASNKRISNTIAAVKAETTCARATRPITGYELPLDNSTAGSASRS
jgi:hypothetical protein